MAFCVLMGKLFKTGKPRRRMVGKQPGRETQDQPFYLETMQEAMGVLKDNPFANAGKRLTGAREASRGLVRRQSKANAAVAPSAPMLPHAAAPRIRIPEAYYTNPYSPVKL